MEEKRDINAITKQLLQNAEENQSNLNLNQTDTSISTTNDNKNIDSKIEDNGQSNQPQNSPVQTKKSTNKIFQKWSVSDVVFLAIVAAVTLLTGAIMPFVTQIALFGIIQLALSLQYSIFIAIALLKVRKTGALLFMSTISGIVLAFMNPIMFFVLVLCALICEGLAILITRGYKNTFSCLMSAVLYIPLSLPFLWVYYRFLFNGGKEVGKAVLAMTGGNIWVNLGMSAAVVALNIVGAIIGWLISKELSKFAFYKK